MDQNGCVTALIDFPIASPVSPTSSTKTADNESRIDRLTTSQMDVLELVALLRTSKEIARELSIAPVTVDQRIKRAQALLGAANRREAARILIAARGRSGYCGGNQVDFCPPHPRWCAIDVVM